MEPPFKNRNSKCCSSVAYQASNIQAISKGSDQCTYAQAGNGLCISHTPICWQFHSVAHKWTSLKLFIETLGRAITDLFALEPRVGVFVCLFVCFKAYSQTKF